MAQSSKERGQNSDSDKAGVTKNSQSALEKYRDLDEIDKHILMLKLKHPAIKKLHLASITGLDRHMVAKRIKRPAWQEAFNEQLMSGRELFRHHENALARKYMALTNSKNESIKEKALSKILVTQGILKPESQADTEAFETIEVRLPYFNETVKIMEAPKKNESGNTTG